MNVIFHTLGCKVNQYETQVMREAFLKGGFSCNNDKNGDIIVINSCSVTSESDRKTRQLVRKCRKENENAIIVLTGCMVQAFPDASSKLTEADIVMGNKDISNIAELTKEFISTKQRVYSYQKHETGDRYITPNITDFCERTRAHMKIEDGCDRFCSYCIIPYSRGRVRSRSLESIKKEACELANKGFCEIVLVGINLSAYGKGEEFNICDAVEVVCKCEKIKRVRLGSLEPDHITDRMLSRLKAQDKFCPQFHLSLQSGCDNTLKRMNRKYDTAFYKELTDKIYNTFEDASITTDVMVGFAGETDEEFNMSKEFVKSVGFARTHIFPYSRRGGTVADKLGYQIENSVKAKRAKEMASVAKLCETEFLKKHIGKSMPVLFESPEGEYQVGYTKNYIRIKVKTDKSLIGSIKEVEITEVFDGFCVGLIK